MFSLPVIFAKLLGKFLPLFICMGIEIVSPRERYTLASRLTGLMFTLWLPLTYIFVTPHLVRLWYSLGVGPLLDLSTLPVPVLILVTVLLLDFLNYWEHRFEHRFLWPVHRVHHSVTELHAANGYGHPLQALAELALITVPMSFVNFGGVGLPLTVQLLMSFQSMVTHSPMRVHYGPLRYVMPDNRFHRIHHSMEERHFDKNFGTQFSIWDQIFGTAYFPKADEWPATGVPGISQPKSFADYILHPFRTRNT